MKSINSEIANILGPSFNGIKTSNLLDDSKFFKADQGLKVKNHGNKFEFKKYRKKYQYCLQCKAVQACMISQPVNSLMQHNFTIIYKVYD